MLTPLGHWLLYNGVGQNMTGSVLWVPVVWLFTRLERAATLARHERVLREVLEHHHAKEGR